MKKEQIDKLMNVLIGLSAVVILFGAYLKLENYPNGDFVLIVGFIAEGIFGGIEISRLKKIIGEFKKIDD